MYVHKKPARECWQHFIPKCPKTGSNQDVLPSQMDGGGPYSDKKMFAIKPQKDKEEPYLHVAKWKEPVEKTTDCAIPTI